jgi:hypothetical protein
VNPQAGMLALRHAPFRSMSLRALPSRGTAGARLSERAAPANQRDQTNPADCPRLNTPPAESVCTDPFLNRPVSQACCLRSRCAWRPNVGFARARRPVRPCVATRFRFGGVSFKITFQRPGRPRTGCLRGDCHPFRIAGKNRIPEGNEASSPRLVRCIGPTPG